MATHSKPHDLPGVIVASLFACLGIVVLFQSRRMTAMGSVFPVTIAIAMIVFSVLLVARNFIVRGQPSGDSGDLGGSNLRRFAFLAIMAAWIGLIPVLGFFITSLVAFFFIAATATYDRISLRESAVLLVVGLAVICGFYGLMARILLIPLPRGLLF